MKIKRIILVIAKAILHGDFFVFYPYIKSILRKTKRLPQTLFLYLVKRCNFLVIENHNNFNKDASAEELLEAFAVLFSNVYDYFIPPQKVKKYSRLLGLHFSYHLPVSNTIVHLAFNAEKLRDQVYLILSSHFKGRLDYLSILEYLYRIEKSYYSKNISSYDYQIVAMADVDISNGKTMYTFDQGRCIVIVLAIDNKYAVMAHYTRGLISDLIDGIKKILKEISFERVRCYTISTEPVDDSVLIKRNLPSKSNCEFYYHPKSKRIENCETYNIKLTNITNNIHIAYTTKPALSHLTSKFMNMHMECGAEIIPTTEYLKMEFTKLDF